MIDRQQLLDLAVRPALAALDRCGVPGGRGAEQLLMGTAAVESSFTYLAQKGGPALGLWQMEPATYDDIWMNFLSFRIRKLNGGALDAAVNGWTGIVPNASRLAWDLRHAAAMARVQYSRAPEPLPAADDLEAMDHIYLLRYNAGGKSTPGEFTAAYRELVAPLFAGG